MILDEIVHRTEKRVALLPSSFPEGRPFPASSLIGAIRNRKEKNAVIAEIKCASPSRGIIRRNVDMPVMAGMFEAGGCVALSILTEPVLLWGNRERYCKSQKRCSRAGPAQGLHHRRAAVRGDPGTRG